MDHSYLFDICADLSLCTPVNKLNCGKNKERGFLISAIEKYGKITNIFMSLGCEIKANCLLVGPGPAGRVPSVGVFLRDPSPYSREI